MTKFKLASRQTALALLLTTTLGVAPASAQGFLDQLFGGGAPQPAQPTFGYQPQQPLSPDLQFNPVRPHRAKKIEAHAEPVSQRQKTTDLWHDKTLRPGDAIMMADGLHVYNGPEAAKHTAKQFVPIDRARHVAPKSRMALLAMDTTRNDPLRKDKSSSDTLASGRSAAVGTPITQGFKITDARGASIRYVGP